MGGDEVEGKETGGEAKALCRREILRARSEAKAMGWVREDMIGGMV